MAFIAWLDRTGSNAQKVLAIVALVVMCCGAITGLVVSVGFAYFRANEDAIWTYIGLNLATMIERTDADGKRVVVNVAQEAFEQAQINAERNRDFEADLRNLRGEDRVIQTEPNSEFASEPVVGGEDVRLNYTIRRTALGVSCLIKSGDVIFRDRRNTPIPGLILTPLQNFGGNWEPVQTTVRPPSSLENGRIRVVINLLYDCDGKTVPDNLPPIYYEQMPAR